MSKRVLISYTKSKADQERLCQYILKYSLILWPGNKGSDHHAQMSIYKIRALLLSSVTYKITCDLGTGKIYSKHPNQSALHTIWSELSLLIHPIWHHFYKRKIKHGKKTLPHPKDIVFPKNITILGLKFEKKSLSGYLLMCLKSWLCGNSVGPGLFEFEFYTQSTLLRLCQAGQLT